MMCPYFPLMLMSTHAHSHFLTYSQVVTNKDLKEDIGRCLRSCDSAVNEILLHTTLEQNKMLSRASGAFSKSATVQGT